MLDLYRARYKRIYYQSFNSEIEDWTGDINQLQWHRVTVDTNADSSSGLMGGIAIDAAGCYQPGHMEKDFTLTSYGEITFDYYLQNSNQSTVINSLKMYVDGVLKFDCEEGTPWRRADAIGLPVGTHTIRFEYDTTDTSGQKVIIDNIEIWEGRKINCIVSKYKPPKPVPKIASNKTLRGFTHSQEMTEADTQIEMTLSMSGHDYLDMTTNYLEKYYFVDEFGICYRGTFPNEPGTDTPALSSLYYIELSMLCPQKVGVGFV